MPKIAMIGAGSIVFCKTLFMDIVATPTLRNSEFRLMSRTMPKLERVKKFADRVIKDNNLDASVSVTLDRREALKDADYVITMLQIGGVDAFRTDYEVPMKHGSYRTVQYRVYCNGRRHFQEIREPDGSPIHTLELPDGLRLDRSSYEVMLRYVLVDGVAA